MGDASERVVAGLRSPFDPPTVAAAADEVGARWTAAPVVTALGGPAPEGRLDPGFEAWRRRCGTFGGEAIIGAVLRRAPWRLPGVVWGQLHVSEEMARFWAHTHGLTYRNRRQVLTHRVLRLLSGVGRLTPGGAVRQTPSEKQHRIS